MCLRGTRICRLECIPVLALPETDTLVGELAEVLAACKLVEVAVAVCMFVEAGLLFELVFRIRCRIYYLQ